MLKSHPNALLRHELPDGYVLALGKLWRDGSCDELRRSRPVLSIVVKCPACGRQHVHGWPEPPFNADEIDHRVADCRDDTLLPRGYYIGLDPKFVKHNRRVALAMSEALERFEERMQGKGLPPR